MSRDRKKFIAKAVIEFGMMMVSFTQEEHHFKWPLLCLCGYSRRQPQRTVRFNDIEWHVQVFLISIDLNFPMVPGKKPPCLDIVADEYCQQLAQVYDLGLGSVLP